MSQIMSRRRIRFQAAKKPRSTHQDLKILPPLNMGLPLKNFVRIKALALPKTTPYFFHSTTKEIPQMFITYPWMKRFPLVHSQEGKDILCNSLRGRRLSTLSPKLNDSFEASLSKLRMPKRIRSPQWLLQLLITQSMD